MSELEPISISPPSDHPRHPQQEIADLLAVALLRLRARPSRDTTENSECVRLGFSSQQRVNANPDHHHGVRP
ncbi:hypothetical protein [Burkholderia multivorans]|jgi:hypothetical protein|uniref:hypothetical protein n=1 Tax=Burkholderia multivorans TaxID=87883 RepID=UPI000CFF79EE|nr:hypothetical protein [Burkholderia multivorans]MBU9122708.1 hypothetical protein [Burkholderia multivorans]PRF47659.1 hypothetical protein C6Q04_16200 [Burkholderia multivorans]PRG56004.1 hypothetical protein C6T63_05425 [Burkholderia multivorans]